MRTKIEIKDAFYTKVESLFSYNSLQAELSEILTSLYLSTKRGESEVTYHFNYPNIKNDRSKYTYLAMKLIELGFQVELSEGIIDIGHLKVSILP